MEDEAFRWLKLALMCAALAWAALRIAALLWWGPRRIEDHFSRHGIRGPPYRFFIGNVKELVGMMMKASSQPMAPPFSHNILPRVLSFYHHWKKIYGTLLQKLPLSIDSSISEKWFLGSVFVRSNGTGF